MASIRVRLAAATVAVSLGGIPGLAASQQDAPAAAPTCLGVMMPSVQGVEGSASEMAAAVRDLFVGFLHGPAIQPTSLEARLPSQAVLEARQNGCGQVLITSVSRKRPGGSKFAGMLGKAAETAAWRMPYGEGVSAAVASGAAIAGAQAISGLASDTKLKDEIELHYRVGTPELVVNAKPQSVKAKAEVDGEDLLTPLVERAAQDVASIVAAP
jgi:hypothetical protein